MKTSQLKFLSISSVVLLSLAASASAQDKSFAPPRPVGVSVGLLGATYAGAEFGYTHQVEGGPRVVRDYGFVYNQPLPEGLDFNLNYDYATGSAKGVTSKQQLAVVGLTGYRSLGWGKAFLQGNVGWAWDRVGGRHDNGFAYSAKTGIEFQLAPKFVLTPYVSYEDAPKVHEQEWNYGVQGNYRFTKEWSASLGAKMDESHNIRYAAGVNFHF
ncbi:MAG: hypothetical protein H7343_21320 [Undibacterium sp.]|nr:hypothetical protein [Opitutaceae bacterium]